MNATSEVVAAAIAEQMRAIRADKAMGLLHEIECDAPLVGLAYELAKHFDEAEPGFDKAAFFASCTFEPDPYDDEASA